MEEQKNVIITYETLFELSRRERDREALQKLDSSFFGDVVNYLKEKRKLLEMHINSANLEEKRKLEKEMESIKRVIKDLYDRREKKILAMAVDKSRTNSASSDIHSMLPEEKQLFDRVAGILDMGRSSIFFTMLEGKKPILELLSLNHPPAKAEGNTEEKTQENTEEKMAASGISLAVSLYGQPEKANEPAEAQGTKLIRFIHALPRFVGPELEEYGPFDAEDMANIPSEIADVLVIKGRAEEIKGS